MISIKDRKVLGQIFSHYDYVMTTAQLSKEKLYYRDVQRMLEAGLIEKIRRGYYHWAAGSGKGDVVIISRLFPDGILCMETALSYYGYSDFLLCSLEVLDDEGNFKRKADMFTKRTIKPHREVTSVETSSEALALSIGEKARVDLPYMEQLTGKTQAELVQDLHGVIFKVPNSEPVS